MYFIHYSCYKHIEYVWRGIKTNPSPKNSTAPGPRPPVLKFLDPPLGPAFIVTCYDKQGGNENVFNPDLHQTH